MKHSARQLAIVLGVQPSTITRDIKKGRVSANKNERGEYEIDASEIVRAYPDRVKFDDAGNIAAKAEMHDEATPKATDATEATAVLKARLDAAERLLGDRERTIDDLRGRLDAESEERRKLTALLTDQRQPQQPTEPEQARKGWRGFLHRLQAENTKAPAGGAGAFRGRIIPDRILPKNRQSASAPFGPISLSLFPRHANPERSGSGRAERGCSVGSLSLMFR